MAKTDDKVMVLVENELKKKPDASVDELYEKAKSADSSVGDLTRRQFNARYPLQVKRRMATEKKEGTEKKEETGKKETSPRRRTRRKKKMSRKDQDSRGAVRKTFLQFASDLVAAEERKDLVNVLARVDRYVDEALKAAGD